MDDQQQIVQWSNAAVQFLGVSEKAALGRPCYEVVRGRDPFGGAVCRPDCAAFRALRSGHLTARCSLRLPWKESPRSAFLAELVALPESSGGAIAILSERRGGPSTSSAGARGTAAAGIPPSSTTDLLRDLVALATLSTSMSPDHLEESMDRALAFLCQATDAEVAELFLREPQGGDVLLAVHSGPFRAAFSQITRFQPGEGFPGLVEVLGAPIATQNLAEDSRYLRTRVKEKGFHSYVSVPLLGASGVTGVLNVAARRADFSLDRALRLLTWASRPIGAVIQAGLLQVRETFGAGLADVPKGTERDLDAFLRAVLHQMMLVGNAVGGALLLYDRNVQGVVRRVTGGEFAGVVCPDMRLGDPQACPALVGGHGMALYGPRRRWPAQCRQMSAGSSTIYCLPLVATGKEMGIVQLRYAGSVPSPPTMRLAVLLNFAERAAEAIAQAWANSRPQPASSGLGVLPQGVDSSVAAAQPSRPRGEPEAQAPDEHPFLEIRCFGAFELHLQGKLVMPDLFRRRGALTLLKILVIQGGRPVARDALVELLWPEADPRTAANRLHVLVHALRQAIEPSQRRGGWLFVRCEGDRYSFNPAAPFRLDISEFREYVSLGERLSRDGDNAAAIEAYEAAVDLYRGDLLEEEPYADWCREQRAHLREICLTVLGRLAAAYLEQGATEESIDHYNHALRIDPLREGNHRGLMRALWSAGRRDEALQEYQVCRDILRRELNVEPLPDTEELHTLIRASRGS